METLEGQAKGTVVTLLRRIGTAEGIILATYGCLFVSATEKNRRIIARRISPSTPAGANGLDLLNHTLQRAQGTLSPLGLSAS